MKNLKKVLALVVVFAMMISTVAFASYPDVDATADYAAAVELLSALDVLKGDDQGNFNPENTITRAEFAAVVCRALGLENSANSAKGATAFTDVAADHWASGYINLASQQKIVNGRGNGIFDPNGNVTFAEAVKMLVVALGYEPMASQRGGYPTGYLTVANSTKMTANVSAGGTDTAALRKTVAMLTANALEIPMMDQTGFGSEVTFEILDDYDNYQTLLTNRDIYVATGVVGDTDNDQGTIEFTLSEASDDFEFGYDAKGNVKDAVEDGEAVCTFEIADSNIEEYYQQNVKAYVYKANKSDYEVLIAVPSGIGSTLTIDANDIAVGELGSEKVAVEYYETAESTKTTKIYVDKDYVTYINGVKTEVVKDLEVFAAKDATIEFVENSDDKYYDIVLVTVYENAIVEEVKADDPAYSRITFVNNKKVDLDLEDDDLIIEIVDKDGKAMDIADFAQYDVLSIVVSELESDNLNPVEARSFKEKIKIMNLGQSAVTGVVTEASDDYIYIDGTEYEVGAFADGNEDEVFDVANDVSSAKLGTEGMFFISATGKIIGFDGEAGANANYGFILQTNLNESGFENGWEIMMLTAEGINTYTLYTTLSLNGTSVKPTGAGASDVADAFEAFEAADEHLDNPEDRIVEYKLTGDGKIKSIAFFGDDDMDDVAADSEYRASSNRIGGAALNTNAIIFDIAHADADDCKVLDVSALVDEGKYEGIVVDKKTDWKLFVMTAGSAKFDAEAPLMYVESVRKSSYGADDAITVKYYTDGSSTLETAIFVDTEADEVYGGKDFDALNKGSIFVVNKNAENLVSEYAVLATMNADYTLDVDTKVLNAMVSDDDDVSFLYGYIVDIDKNDVTVSNNINSKYDSFNSRDSYNDYQFNTSLKTPTVEIRGWDSNGVDAADEGNGYFGIFVKLYNNEAIDVYTVSEALEADDFKGAIVAEAEEVVEVEIEEVEDLDFE